MKVQDIVPIKTKKLPARKSVTLPILPVDVVAEPEEVFVPIKRKKAVRFSFRSPFFLYSCIALLFIGAVYGLLVYFASAKVYITAKSQTVTLEKEVFTANRDLSAALHFEVMMVNGEEKRDTTFSEMNTKDTKAVGTVVIYNEYSTKPVKLTINTRLADEAGHIYFTDEALNIPGYTLLGKKIIPGSIEVGITASVVGDTYNSEPKDFTLLGFKGKIQYTKIYARSKTAITGGSRGTVYGLSAEEKGVAVSDVTSTLKAKLVKKLQAQVPPGYITYPGSMDFKVDANSGSLTSLTKEGSVTISGTLSATIFKERELEEAVIRSVYNNVSASELSEITIPELASFILTLAPENTTLAKGITKVSFDLSGPATLLWHPNLEILPSQLVGMEKDSLETIFTKDPGIAHARVVFRPPWQSRIPENPEKIKIVSE